MASVSGLMCDTPGCDYRDETISESDYVKYINFPCPKCGGPLLTQKDYDALIILKKAEELAISLGLAKVFPQRVKIKLHGNGLEDADITMIKE